MSDADSGPKVATAAPRVRVHTVVVDGPLALGMRRLRATRHGTAGLQIVTIAQLAAHLAGGFARPAASADLEVAVGNALRAGGFAEITPLADLPGMVRATIRTLERLWQAGVMPADHAGRHPRLADLALLDSRVRAGLGGGARAAPDLVRAALTRREMHARLTGEVTFERVHYVAPVWRPMLEALAESVQVTWEDCAPPPGWAAGSAKIPPERASATIEVVSCAHPQAEVIEALRWARELLASGKAKPAEIAIAAASPESWDDTMLGLAEGAPLPIHFTHGIPALCSIDGQTCAALADILAQGLSYGRVQRLLVHSAGRCLAMPALPPRPLAGVPAGAALTTLDQWRRALAAASSLREDGFDILAALAPVLETMTQGLAAAENAGEQLLPRAAAALWRIALRRAPAAALPFTLTNLRVADGKDPGANIAWGPATHLTGAPRAWTRLIGMTSRAWPRPHRADPLLPEHILAVDSAASPRRPDVDRRCFQTIRTGTATRLSLSYARRTAVGGAQAPSPLLPPGVPRRLARLRIPAHAYSESDRLQARPKDGIDQPRLSRPVACARARLKPELTPWDGVIRADHPVVIDTLARVQSSSSLRQLLRDPQAFVWHYALGWEATLEQVHTLSLDDQDFGDLVHRLLQHSVTMLERGPGFGRAADHELEEALGLARQQVLVEWPTMRPTPPPMLWRHTLDKASELALVALRLDGTFEPGTRSWTEVPFGGTQIFVNPPWDVEASVPIPGTNLEIRGRIDRLEVAAGDRAVRITDYKTGRAPANAAAIILAGGAELQRVLYSVAARLHFPDARIRADQRYPLSDPESAMRRVAELLNSATQLLRAGTSLPGRDAREGWNPYRLARPAKGEPPIKDQAITQAFGAFQRVWAER
jgi:hypothetical protein